MTTKLSFVSLLAFASLSLAVSGCADDPSPLEEAAHHVCQCNSITNGAAANGDLTACETEVTVSLKTEMASCIACLNKTITDNPTEATCTASFDCATCTSDN